MRASIVMSAIIISSALNHEYMYRAGVMIGVCMIYTIMLIWDILEFIKIEEK